MAAHTAQLSNYRQSPRKVRLVANLIRGKKVAIALNQLAFLPKRAGHSLKKLIESAVANAKNAGTDTDSLFIKEIRVDQGVTLKRWMPRARGRAFPIHKRSSHVIVVLDEKVKKAPAAKTAPKAKSKTKAKVVA